MRYVYLALSVVGLVGTWWFNLASAAAGEDYLAGWFATAASSSAAVDILVTGLAACVFMVIESRRLGWAPWVPVVLVIASFAIAVACVFPLFLFLRDRSRRDRSRSHTEVPA